MKQPRMRLTALVFVLSLVVALLAPNRTLPVSADGPQKLPHIMHTSDWYKQQRANRPFGSTNNLIYHGGPIMQSVRAYTIFWSPTGVANPIPNDYQTLINRYFTDLGGSLFYNINTQYYQNPGPVFMQNNSTLGGTWLDTANAYPHAGNASDPLGDADIQAEVQRAITANGWPNGGLTNQYFVYTAQGITSCAGSQCTPNVIAPPGTTVYCAYHSAFTSSGNPVIYANMPYAETWNTTCRQFFTSPNNNFAADSEISQSSHEQFEAATDPEGDAWNDVTDPSKFLEIGDKCGYNYLATADDGHNVTLNHHFYIVQSEWSNAAFNGTADSGCALRYGAPQGAGALLGTDLDVAMTQVPLIAAEASIIQISSSAAFIPFITH